MAGTNFSCTAQSGGWFFPPHFFLGNQTSVIRDYLSIRDKTEKNKTWLVKNSGQISSNFIYLVVNI